MKVPQGTQDVPGRHPYHTYMFLAVHAECQLLDIANSKPSPGFLEPEWRFSEKCTTTKQLVAATVLVTNPNAPQCSPLGQPTWS